MSEEIKGTATPAAGYVYQTRQGLLALCEWLDAPSRYARVKFECDDEAEAPTGLDDIVIERSDGLVDLKQVKFTPNPDAYPLCWEWLLEKSGVGADSKLSHRADPNLSQGWTPSAGRSSVDKCRSSAVC